jgi:hypothetical protein
LNDIQYDLLRKWVSSHLQLKCVRTVGDVRREEMSKVAVTLKMKDLPNGRKGVIVDLPSVIKYLSALLSSSSLSSSKWKLSVDGRQLGKRKEVMVGITPLSFGINTQSCDNVFPISIWQGDYFIIYYIYYI